MNSGSDAQIANTLHRNTGTLVLRSVTFLTVLDRDLGKANADSTNVATKDITTIQCLPGTHSVIQTFKVNYPDD
jgi:hypothetical protein